MDEKRVAKKKTALFDLENNKKKTPDPSNKEKRKNTAAQTQHALASLPLSLSPTSPQKNLNRRRPHAPFSHGCGLVRRNQGRRHPHAVRPPARPGDEGDVE
jgi:hypothetical protein